MKTKRIFSILNLVACVLTIIFVSLYFVQGLNSGKTIYYDIYEFSRSADANNLNNNLSDCTLATELAFDSNMADQIEYIPKLHTTLDRLVASENFLSSKLLFDDKKSVATTRIYNNYSTLSDMRSELIHKLYVYKIKMDGNTYGDPEGTFALIIEDILEYINLYQETIAMLNNYVYNSAHLITETNYNLIEIQTKIVKNLCTNLDYTTFKNNSLKNLTAFNKRFGFDSDNNLIIKTSVVGGLYSEVAYKFNNYYSKCNPSTFASKFYDMSTLSINPATESDNCYLAYYYLDKLLKEAL